MLAAAKIVALFAATAFAEILGCYLTWRVVKMGQPAWLLLFSGLALAAFAALLTLHPGASGRTYAAYGGVYMAVALAWLRYVDGVALTRWDLLGGALTLAGMALIRWQPAG